ncbi:MAG: endonuclease [Candidatus Cloacimonadaceae bacterium]|jgi:endonuclease I|nr:endonuclease [Candidatus Cloacimonadota bacterium]MDY0127338.1 endonuclease [Candidatus Cloacimonadaceae bacterium]MCB5254527.1 endonuclease [Candidatus Cloacimonadota bacterium]MCK9178706.1 endonuclease [Candidatus Cloacimonadota bacterium]MCK9242837.1 endonuclease [Candidatus Cloacimonadota bacterium]
MNIKIKTICTLFVLLLAFGAGADYYDGVDDLTGDDLLYALRNLISTNTYSSYSGAKVFLFQELDNVNGQVTCVYTGETYNISSSYSGQSSPNTEHTYAQSWFNPSSSVKKADLHHLFITTMQVNSSRGNLPFGNVASTAASDVYYSHTPLQSYRGYDNWQHTVFQVNPEYRGNTARAILYFYTRYGDSLYQGGVNMLDTMIQWHYSDPPDAAEQSRNDALHGFQYNRNPFVDHPEYVNRIWNPGIANEDDIAQAVPALRVDNVYPNPFRNQVNIALDAKAGASIKAAVYNLRGEKVYQQELGAGKRQLSWDGRDSAGISLPAGVYFIRFKAGDSQAISKVLLIR